MFRCKHPLSFSSMSVSDSNGISLLYEGACEQLVVARFSSIMIIEELGAGLSRARFSCWNFISVLRWGRFSGSFALSCIFFTLMQVTYPNPFYKAQMLLPGWAMNLEVAKSKHELQHHLTWLRRQEGLPTNLARVYTPKGLTHFHVFTNSPYAAKSLGRNQTPKKP